MVLKVERFRLSSSIGSTMNWTIVVNVTIEEGQLCKE